MEAIDLASIARIAVVRSFILIGLDSIDMKREKLIRVEAVERSYASSP